MRKALLLSAAIVAVTQFSAAASPPPPVKTGTGGCTGNYSSGANYNSVHVCVYNYDPDVYTSDAPCTGGDSGGGSAIVGKWVCVSTG